MANSFFWIPACAGMTTGVQTQKPPKGLLVSSWLFGHRLEQAHAVALGILHRDPQADAGDHCRLHGVVAGAVHPAEDLAAVVGDALHGGLDVLDGDHDGGGVGERVLVLLVEAAVDGAGGLHHPLSVRLGGLRDDVAAHLGAHLLHLPAEDVGIELLHALAVVVAHLEMHDWIHGFVGIISS